MGANPIGMEGAADSETPADELARLVREYETAGADDPTEQEAWNLIADFAVCNAETICAALSLHAALAPQHETVKK